MLKKRAYIARAKRSDWCTPTELYNELNKEFNFTTDIAATKKNRLCFDYITPRENALAPTTEWGDRNWCNPPYGRGLAEWVRKADELTKYGHTTVMLIPARVDTAWFHRYVLGTHEIRFLRGRVKFKGAKSGAPFPSMIVVFRGSYVKNPSVEKTNE